MENIFSTNLSINGKNKMYRVVFEDDKYVFIADSDDGELSNFSIRRENDEWHEQPLLPAEVKKEAVTALDNYLLSQH